MWRGRPRPRLCRDVARNVSRGDDAGWKKFHPASFLGRSVCVANRSGCGVTGLAEAIVGFPRAWQPKSASLSCRLESLPLIPSAAKNVENIGSPARSAIVDEVFSCRKAFHPGSDVLRRPPGIGMFAEQPEAVDDPINQAVRNLCTCAPCPININLVEVLFRLLCDPIAHCLFGRAGVRGGCAAGARQLGT